MNSIFLQVLNMSLTASYVILLVLLVRLVLKRAPKIYSYVLWAAVLFRLIIPFSFESMFSLIAINTNTIPADIVYSNAPQINMGITAIDNAANTLLATQSPVIDPMQVWISAAIKVWIIGMAILSIYGIVSLIHLRFKLVGAIKLRDNIYIADHIPSPFVIGLIRPKIYLPSNLSRSEQQYIILHEQTHIKRCDHIIKLLAFTALTVHWFNPLVWIAFFAYVKDMEMSCDESVLKHKDIDVRCSYSKSLLNLSTNRKNVVAIPLAFGETDTKSRIKNILRYKKPVFWVVVTGIILCAALVVCLIVNPKTEILDTQQTDILSLVLDRAFSEAIKVEKINEIETDSLILRDTAYLIHADRSNICEVIFPLKDNNGLFIGVSFVKDDKWELASLVYVKIYDHTIPKETEDTVIDLVIECVESRNIVPTEYLISINGDSFLMVLLEKYNIETFTLQNYFYNVATKTISFVFEDPDWNPEYPPSYPVSSQEYENMVLRIVANSLYKDCTQRFLDDPVLYQLYVKEGGGSAGMWPILWHTSYMEHVPEMKLALYEYFDLVDDIMKRLVELR